MNVLELLHLVLEIAQSFAITYAPGLALNREWMVKKAPNNLKNCLTWYHSTWRKLAKSSIIYATGNSIMFGYYCSNLLDDYNLTKSNLR